MQILTARAVSSHSLRAEQTAVVRAYPPVASDRSDKSDPQPTMASIQPTAAQKPIDDAILIAGGEKHCAVFGSTKPNKSQLVTYS